MARINLYCHETPGLKLGPGTATADGASIPGEVIVFRDGYADFDPEDFPQWADWITAVGTPPIRILDTGEGPGGEVCPVCGKSFTSSRALNGHLLSHRSKAEATPSAPPDPAPAAQPRSRSRSRARR